ncbi:MAG: PAS domain S-box protein [Defluviicoccus sp.]
MQDRKRVAALILILIAVAVIVGATASIVLYEAAVERERLRLVDLVRSQARLMEAVAEFNQTHVPAGAGAAAATLAQIEVAHTRFQRTGLGTSGEFVIGRREGESIVFLLRHRHTGLDVPAAIEWSGTVAGPMRAALSGHSGSMVGTDYAGDAVIAAYEPVAILGLGLVAKLDLWEVRARYVRAGAISGLITLVVVAGAAAFVYRLVAPIIRGLRESELRVRALLDASRDEMMLLSADGTILAVNAAAEQRLGAAGDDVSAIGHGLDRFLPARVAAARMRALKGVLATGAPVQFEEAIGERTNDCRVYPVKGADQPSSEVALHARDVTADRRKEAELRLLYRAIEQSPVSVVVTDPAARILYVNPKFSEITGYSETEVIGQNPRVLQSGDKTKEEYEALWKQLSEGHVWRGEFLNKKKSGELYCEVASIAPVRDQNGRITNYVAVKEDVTKLKATEAQLRQAQKMEAIGQLTGGIAHDFNNLLTIIIGNLQLIQESVADNKALHVFAEDALWSAQRGAELTHRLLAFARRQPLSPTVADLNAVVRGISDLFRRTLGSAIEIREDLAASVHAVVVDRSELERALVNLAINARDAMPDGGVLTIKTKNSMLDEDYTARYPDVAPGSYVLLAVTDNGIGMSREIKSRILEPFFTTKPPGRGSGLGLSMVYGFLKQSGGHVSVYSELGHGTTVKLFFPAAPASVPIAQEGEGRGTEPTFAGQVVLVIEDDERLRKVARAMLTRAGLIVLEAGDGATALAQAAAAERLDLVFTDLELAGGMSGHEIAERVQALRPGVKVLFTSGYSSVPASLQGAVSPSPPTVAKPYARGALMRHVGALLPADGELLA